MAMPCYARYAMRHASGDISATRLWYVRKYIPVAQESQDNNWLQSWEYSGIYRKPIKWI